MCGPASTYPREVGLTGDIGKFAKNWAGVRLAHEAVMVEDARNLLARNRANTYTEGAAPDSPTVDVPDEDGEMHIGDVNHNYVDSSESRQRHEMEINNLRQQHAAREEALSKQLREAEQRAERDREALEQRLAALEASQKKTTDPVNPTPAADSTQKPSRPQSVIPGVD